MSREIRVLTEEEVKNAKFEYEHEFYYKSRVQSGKRFLAEKLSLTKLGEKFRDLINGGIVADYGGAGGIHYFQYKPDETVNWVVYETENVVNEARNDPDLIKFKNLDFEYSDKLMKEEFESDLPVYFYSVGAVHYREDTLELLRVMAKHGKAIFLEHLYSTPGRSILGEQVGVGLNWTVGIEDLKEIFKDFEIIIDDKNGNKEWKFTNSDLPLNEIHFLAVRK